MDQSNDGLYLLDYGAGNSGSVINAVEFLGYKINVIKNEKDFENAKKVIFPGVGSFDHAMRQLRNKGFIEPLLKYVAAGKPLLGICVGMQVLFEGSEESPSEQGLGILKGRVSKFSDENKTVPNIGWNSAVIVQEGEKANDFYGVVDKSFYFVHSYAVMYTGSEDQLDYVYSASRYKDEVFVSSVWKDNIFATQFHPEKSGKVGLKILEQFIKNAMPRVGATQGTATQPEAVESLLSVRVVACMDVRENDHGDLVVTKGDQYDVREDKGEGQVRNLGKPVDLATKYYTEGADEVVFLNITSFRNIPVNDYPMLEILRRASKTVFVPMTVGGGIRSITDPASNKVYSAVDIADLYFRAGADKISIGSDSVYAAENYINSNRTLDGSSSVEQISKQYGSQAVVVSIDPKRVYVDHPSCTSHTTIKTMKPGPNNEEYCWFQVTVKGGREARDLDVVQLATAVQALGAGEILLNCIDTDGSNSGYDLELLSLVRKHVTIPIVASSGAGKPDHFLQAINIARSDAVLAAGVFHRDQLKINDVKRYLMDSGVNTRPSL
ncbi:Imidazole glycerol phosphate synthase hisHF [Zancudomyces culisetae]|uniref:Imidazole glycerol phosphate synthase hisHF n=1 Tax=Zancudomyces culisetae TaxID=1213189 RepID=A0A1R1PTW3_ZANCU|nr:Imidazole glycerol phosphate synthase hisHF [Zancudomyces culisetae]OMH84359.1 Imidazole glycerol phosphate synthase hisHF [Zancudomyces culisetae]|eukprot:OMH83241.1 Imidazole glycerol phosphate synthase hisHF [Zancudomyces culisetae]